MIIQKESTLNLAIPDGEKNGISNKMLVHTSAKGVSSVSVHLNITHSWPEDLFIQLTAPTGQKATLVNKGDAHGQGINQTFSGEVMNDLLGGDATGTWDLKVIDYSKGGKGTLNSWSLKVDCQGGGQGSEVFINPNKEKGIKSLQLCRFRGSITDISASVDITHYSIRQLEVMLIAPSGKSVMLHNGTGGDQGRLQKSYGKDILGELIGEKTNGQWKLTVKDMKGHPSGQLNHWKVNLKYRPIDDLKIVEGIGPKIESLLNEAGIYSFARLAASSPAYVRQILANAGDRFTMHNPETWPKQAEMAEKGTWDQLKVWQDELDGGKVIA